MIQRDLEELRVVVIEIIRFLPFVTITLTFEFVSHCCTNHKIRRRPYCVTSLRSKQNTKQMLSGHFTQNAVLKLLDYVISLFINKNELF